MQGMDSFLQRNRGAVTMTWGLWLRWGLLAADGWHLLWIWCWARLVCDCDDWLLFAGGGALVAVCAARMAVAEGGGGHGRAAWWRQLQHCVQLRW